MVTAQSQRPANGADDNQYNHCPVCDGVDSQHIIRPDRSLHPRQTISLMHVISFKNAIKIQVNGPLFTCCASCHTNLARFGRSQTMLRVCDVNHWRCTHFKGNLGPL